LVHFFRDARILFSLPVFGSLPFFLGWGNPLTRAEVMASLPWIFLEPLSLLCRPVFAFGLRRFSFRVTFFGCAVLPFCVSGEKKPLVPSQNWSAPPPFCIFHCHSPALGHPLYRRSPPLPLSARAEEFDFLVYQRDILESSPPIFPFSDLLFPPRPPSGRLFPPLRFLSFWRPFSNPASFIQPRK